MASHNAFREEEDPASNPYLPPATLAPGTALKSVDTNSLVAWEWLRIPYNGVLIVVVILARILLVGTPAQGFWQPVVGGAVLANICFCVGPVAEFYLGLIHFRGPRLRGILFVLGTLFAILLALGSLLSL